MTRIIKAEQSSPRAATRAAALNLADFAAEAREVVLDARKAAARISAEARAKAQSIGRQAREEGYTEGLARGRSEGYAEGGTAGRQEVIKQYGPQYADLLRQAGQVLSALADARRDAVSRASAEAVEMALLLAERIVGVVAARGTEAATANLAKALDLAQCGGQMVVSVNPAELQALNEELPALVEAIGIDGQVELVGDESISPGGVKLAGPGGRIDATIEAQIANAARVLLGHESWNTPSEPPSESPGIGHYVKTPEGTLKPTSYA